VLGYAGAAGSCRTQARAVSVTNVDGGSACSVSNALLPGLGVHADPNTLHERQQALPKIQSAYKYILGGAQRSLFKHSEAFEVP